jgi:hypothetical protein
LGWHEAVARDKESDTLRRYAQASSAGSTGGSGESRGRFGPFAALLALIVFAAFAPAASAALAPGYGPIGGFDPGISSSTGPRDIAVDDATGNVLLADIGNSRVLVLAPDLSPGGTGSLLTEFSVPHPAGVAVDQSTHAVYVSEDYPGNQIERFVSDGAPVPTYTLDPTFTPISLRGSGSGSAYGELRAPLAVDPATHDLLVAENDSVFPDGVSDHITRYSSTGASIGSFAGTDTPAKFLKHITDVAASATEVYVIDNHGLQQFDSQGTFEQTIGGLAVPNAAAVEGGSGRLVTIDRTGGPGPGRLSTFVGGAMTGAANATAPGLAYVEGLAVDGGAAKRAYVAVSSTTAGISINVFQPAPGAQADSVSSPSSGSAHLTGIVNPEGKPTTAHFEYCSERDPCATDPNAAWTLTPDVAVGEGSGDVPISTDIEGLDPHSKYSVRIAAADPVTSDLSNTATLVTADEAPTSETGAASAVGAFSANLAGAVNPLGLQGSYYFEYGETTAYGNSTSPGVVGHGFKLLSVSRTVTGLQPLTTYHYRVVGVNAAGISPGEDKTFTTVALPTTGDGRAYEMASPVEKAGVPVHFAANAHAAPDGNAILYGAYQSAFPGAQSAPVLSRYLSTRSGTNWSTAGLDLPFDNFSPGSEHFFSTIAVNDDLSRVLALSQEQLTPDGVEGEWNLYVTEPATGNIHFIASDPKLGALAGISGEERLAGVSPDLRTVVFKSGGVYAAIAGKGVQLVSVSPDGKPQTGDEQNGFNSLRNPPRAVSADGTRIYFTQTGGGQVAVYLRENVGQPQSQVVGGECVEPEKACTVLVSATGSLFLGASVDGSLAEVRSPSGAILLYHADTKTLTDLSAGGPGGLPTPTFFAYPERGEAYYVGEEGNWQHAQDGVVTKVSSEENAETSIEYMGSPNGRFFTYILNSRVMLYDAQLDTLVCASCVAGGGSAGFDFHIGQTNGTSSTGPYTARSVLDDGTLFFDTAEPLLVADANDARDVYSYRAGQLTLISPGAGQFDSEFKDATPSGSDVFFTTKARLVAQDRDTLRDMYDARMGGGLAAQNEVKVECAGADCRGAIGPPAAPATIATEAVNGPGNAVRVKGHKKKRHARKHAKKHRRAKHQRTASHKRGGKR